MTESKGFPGSKRLDVDRKPLGFEGEGGRGRLLGDRLLLGADPGALVGDAAIDAVQLDFEALLVGVPPFLVDEKEPLRLDEEILGPRQVAFADIERRPLLAAAVL